MTIAYISVAIGWLFLVTRIASWLKRLMHEVEALPEREQPISLGSTKIDHSIYESVTLPEAVKGRHAVLLVSSPTCPPCHEALSEFLQVNQNLQVPFVCLAEADNAEYYERFCDDYKERAQIAPIRKTSLDGLGIKRFPTFFVIDDQGMILREFIMVSYLVKFVEQIRMGMMIGEQDGR